MCEILVQCARKCAQPSAMSLCLFKLVTLWIECVPLCLHANSDVHMLLLWTCLSALAVWSSGMILVQGARGPGFNSQNGPVQICFFSGALAVVQVHMCMTSYYAHNGCTPTFNAPPPTALLCNNCIVWCCLRKMAARVAVQRSKRSFKLFEEEMAGWLACRTFFCCWTFNPGLSFAVTCLVLTASEAETACSRENCQGTSILKFMQL